MKEIICPLDGRPCEKNCPDRYRDQPEGGRWITIAQELGAQVIILDEASGTVGCIFHPKQRKEA